MREGWVELQGWRVRGNISANGNEVNKNYPLNIPPTQSSGSIIASLFRVHFAYERFIFTLLQPSSSLYRLLQLTSAKSAQFHCLLHPPPPSVSLHLLVDPQSNSFFCRSQAFFSENSFHWHFSPHVQLIQFARVLYTQSIYLQSNLLYSLLPTFDASSIASLVTVR